MTAAALAGCIVFLVAFGTFWYFSTLKSIDHEVDLRLRAEMGEIVGSPEPDRRDLMRRIERRIATRGSFAFGYLLLDPAKRPIAGSVRMAAPPLGISDTDFSDRAEGLGRVATGRALAIRLTDGSEMAIVADSDPLDQNQRLIAELLVVGLLVSALAFAIGTTAIMIATNRRLASIATTTQAILSGDMTQRLPVGRRNDVFDREARLLNGMLDRIAELLDNLRNVSGDIAHDLRTPLTRLRARLVAAEERAMDEAGREDMKRALAECDQLLGLFAAILRLSEIDSGQRRAAFAPVALDDVIRTIADSFSDPVLDGGRTLRMGPIVGATIAGDRTLLAQMIVNAIDNAVQHTPIGTEITVSLTKAATGLALTIADDGRGIPEASRDHVLRRFAKLDESGSGPGYGLGLTLIASIAHLHDAEVRLTDNRPGLIVTILIPAENLVRP